VTFDRVHLLEERPDRVWEAIAEAPFRAAAVIGRGGLPLELTVTTTLDAEASAFQDAEWGAYARASYGADAAPDMPMAVTARRDGRIVGIAAGQVTGDMAYLANLITAADVRNQGVGAALLAAFESEAAARGCVRLTLRTQADGPARQFYERHGWVELHPLPGWRHGRDFVQMERRLT
jgi:GNAT superfamily N-acetyltransferase